MTQPVKARFGPSTAILLIIIVILAGVAIYRHTRHTPPIIENTVTGGSATRGIAPVPEFLLRHKRELVLADPQLFAITDLAAEYRSEIQGPSQHLRKAADAYQTYLEAQKNAKKVNAQALAEAGAEVERLSGDVAAARHAYWTKARAVLTPAQQSMADALAAHPKASDLE